MKHDHKAFEDAVALKSRIDQLTRSERLALGQIGRKNVKRHDRPCEADAVLKALDEADALASRR